MEEPKENKKLEPAHNKQGLNKAAADVPTQLSVRIKMKPNRRAAGVTVDENGYATVDTKTAEWLVSIQYADLAKEK